METNTNNVFTLSLPLHPLAEMQAFHMATLWDLQSCYSDMYKELYGFRPRSGINWYDAQELSAAIDALEIDWLRNRNELLAHWEALDAQEAQYDRDLAEYWAQLDEMEAAHRDEMEAMRLAQEEEELYSIN